VDNTRALSILPKLWITANAVLVGEHSSGIEGVS
jgi:hypothetical protein